MPLSNTTATPLSSSSLSKFSGPQIDKASSGEYVFMYSHHITHRITHQAPKIPRALPAPYNSNHGKGTLDRLLDNLNSTTPSSTLATQLSSSPYSKLSGLQIGKALNGEDIFLYSQHITPQAPEIPRAIPEPFGEIERVKSIIDDLINTFKGYGFIKYYSFADAEYFILEFYCRGHEAKIAKVGPLIANS